ncbi:hypothetical protein UK23_21475 [Lentzea aerocolonigenes]|uniref:ESX secretion-associated protein EspG n=1 Tax=Lentzea aerocolonigenes TaxID=68170 RepID=A0A0F0GUW9_LENAE|nr:ESX secretion-associated protein EspG [Lentzea aerocolonigenes]KJK47080.1 hypothetical protein UK23_21475 [Lentzea aerocolonigenes]
MVAKEIVCSLAALDVLGEALRIDVRWFPFAIPYHGATSEDRVRLVEAVHRDLVARGLVRHGEFVPELVEALHLFAHGRQVIALVGSAGDSRLLALATADDRMGLVAAQRDETITFRLCRPDAIVPGVVRLLPVVRPGPGMPVTVSGTAASAGRPRGEKDFSEMTFRAPLKAAASSPAGQWAAAEGILRRPRLGAGYFLVSARGRNGQENELGMIGYLDTDAGRYAVIPMSAPDERLVATYAPADLAGLGRHLNRIVESRQ